jgi:alpha-tubulin suppressor-like RCC1 family protein
VGRIGKRGHAGLVALVALLALMGATAGPAAASAASPGQLYAFGDDDAGELGNAIAPNPEPNSTPVPVALPGEVGSVTQAATGDGWSLVVTSGGQLYAFGNNADGELGKPDKPGNYEATSTPTPVTLPGASGSVTDAAGGGSHSLAVTSSGQLYAFGSNYFGQLGNTTNTYSYRANPTPALVTLPGATGPVTQAAAGQFFSLALTATGQLYAFGDNSPGQLGSPMGDFDDHFGPNPTPRLVTLPDPVTRIAAGYSFSLAVTSTGQLYAFGENSVGELGAPATGGLEPNPTPALVALPGEVGPVTQVAAGSHHSLVLTASGQLYAFGENRKGQLGNATNLESSAANPTPRLVDLPGASGRIIGIAAGGEDSLALTSTGELYAFGLDSSGELGFPPGEKLGEPHPTPKRVALPGPNAETIATGCCAIHTLVTIADLVVSSTSLPAGEAGLPYSTQAQATGGAAPYRWSATGLPPGLAIDPASGAISGTPSAGGRYTPTITVTDSYGIEASASPALTVQPLPTPPSESAPLAAPARVGSPRVSNAPGATRETGRLASHGGSLVDKPLDAPLGGAGLAASANSLFGAALDMPPDAAAAASPISPLGVSPSVASSWSVHKYLGQITKAGSEPLENPVGLAFDAAGDLLVTDTAEKGFVYRYGPSNGFECRLGGQFPNGFVSSVAVDDETGDVYVAESGEEEIWLFKPEAGCAYKPPIRVPAEGKFYLAVDNAPGPHHGEVYVVEVFESLFDAQWFALDVTTNGEGELTGSGTLLPEAAEPEGDAEKSNNGIAVDPASGTIYVPNPGAEDVVIYNSKDELQPQTLSTGERFEPIAVAVDPTNGEVYVLDAKHDVVDEFDSQGELVGEITGAHTPAGKFIEPRDVAVKPSTHEVYVSDAGAHAIDVFGAAEQESLPAKPTTEAASAIGSTGATLNGSLEHASGEALSWFFRYARGSSCTAGRKQTERTLIAEGETGLLHEHATIAELEPATEYTVCLSDEGAEGAPDTSTAASFETEGFAPQAGSISVAQLTSSGAVLESSVNPENEATKYRFEYATKPDFEGAIGADEESFAKGIYPSQPVNPADLGDLAPDTTYYVRLFAENATGHYTGPANSFTTLAAAPSAVSFWSASEGETVAQARLEGYVNPAYQSTTCSFQYTTEAEHALHDFTGATEVPCAPSPFGSAMIGFSEVVTATARGLAPGVTYDYRLIATNGTGASEGPLAPVTATFTTWGPPDPTTEPAANPTPHSATLAGTIDPDRLATAYHYEYASESAYEQAKGEGRPNPYVDGRSTPLADVSAGAGRETLPATVVSELEAGITYHFRLVATNEAGTRYGQDQTLTTADEQMTQPTEGTTVAPIQVISPPPSPSQTSVPPAVTHARQSATRWRESNRLARVSRATTPTGTTFSFSLNEQAKVSFSFIQILGGTSAAHGCLASRRKSCDTLTRGSLSFVGRSGTNRVAFAGWISHTDKLKPGRYELAITATNSAGQRSASVSLSFTIAPPMD